MNKKGLIFIASALIFSLILGGALILADSKCDEKVTLKSGRVIDARKTTPNGSMLVIQTCDGDIVKIPVSDVEIVESK